MVKVVVSGDLRLESLTIDPEAVDPEDVEMLQDLVLAAANEALRQAEELAARRRWRARRAPAASTRCEALESLGLGDALGGLGGGGRRRPPRRRARRHATARRAARAKKNR